MKKTVLFALLGLAASTQAQATTKIEWWHAMGGKLGERVQEIASDFNASQSEYKVVPVYKGSYSETMTTAIAAFRAKKAPHIVQVYEVGTATMMAAKGAIYPVETMMEKHGVPLNKSDYLPAVISYYQTPEGKLLSMPFNSSTPVLWYNKTAFKKAGISKVPATWSQMKTASQKLRKAGYSCGFTSGWQSWVLMENYSAWNNLPIGTKANGFGGLNTKFVFNNKHVVNRLQKIKNWSDKGLFKYGGRGGDSKALFVNQKCGMWLTSSASYAAIKKEAKFSFGQSMMPFDDAIRKKPQNSIIGGATLWVLKGRPASEYKGVAKFMSFLSTPKIQARWHQQTGYVPITKSAYKLSQKQGFYKKNPGTDTAIKELSLNRPTANSRGLRFGNYVQVRDIINEELENLWRGKKSAAKAMNDAANKGNKMLRRFEKAHK